jgi:hypothetical protein
VTWVLKASARLFTLSSLGKPCRQRQTPIASHGRTGYLQGKFPETTFA